MALALLSVLVWISTVQIWSAEVADDAFSALAVLLGGIWVLYQFVLRRSFESGLTIDIQVSGASNGSSSEALVHLDICLSNVGNRRLACPPFLDEDAFEDYEQSVDYPADLQIMRVKEDHRPRYLGWWYGEKRKFLEPVKADPLEPLMAIPLHINLLYEHTRLDRSEQRSTAEAEQPITESVALGEKRKRKKTRQRTHFFMEPGERCVLGHTFVLGRGDYLAKVVFVGSRARASEYWSRITAFRVRDEVQSMSDGSLTSP